MVPEAKIGEFLIELSENEKMFRRFEQYPEEVMEEYGLDESQREIVLGDDLGRLREAIQSEFPDAANVFVALWWRPVH
jgi:hypothetical protein